MTQTPFEIFKQTCTDACHQRHACADGYRQMLASENVSQMMATWRDNWDDVVKSKYADIILAELPKMYPTLRDEMNEAGIYLNECPVNAQKFVKVLITDTSEPIHIYGNAKSYILGDATVVAHDHSQVYNFRAHAEVSLLDHSYGHLLPTDKVSKGQYATLSNH